MKRILTISLSALLLSVLAVQTAKAQTVYTWNDGTRDWKFWVIDAAAKTACLGQGDTSNNWFSDGSQWATPDPDELTDLVLPTTVSDGTNTYTVTSIGTCAFAQMKNVRSITVPEGYTTTYNRVFMCHSAGMTASNLARVSLPSTLTNMGVTAFYGCLKLTNVELPSKLTTLPDYTFYSCTQLAELTLPETVTSIGPNAFTGATIPTLTSLNPTPPTVTAPNTLNNQTTSTLRVPAEGLADYKAVNWWSNFGTYEKIGGYVPPTEEAEGTTFLYNDGTRDWKCWIIDAEKKIAGLGTGFTGNGFNDTLRVIENPATLTDIVTPTKVVFPETGTEYTVTTIGSAAFYNVQNVRSITISEGVTTTCQRAFMVYPLSFNSSLETVNLPASIVNFGQTAFYGCPKLKNVTLPANLTTIPGYTFWNCMVLKEITIPASVKTIEANAFNYPLTFAITCLATTPPALAASNNFSTASQSTLYVPEGTKALYEAADVWKNFGTIKEIGHENDEDIEISSANLAKDGNYYASLYYSDKAFTVPTGVTATTYKVTDGALQVSKEYAAGDVIPAGQAVIISAQNAGTFTFSASTAAGTADTNSMLYGSDAAYSENADGYMYYILATPPTGIDGADIGFWWQAEGGKSVSNAAHKAYLKVPTAAAAGAKGWTFGGETTGIKTVDELTSRQVDEFWYTLDGQRLTTQPTQKGVYITGGKKVVIK